MVRHVGSLRFSSLAALAACLGIASHYLAVNDAVALAAQPLAVYGWALTLAVASTVLPIVLVTEGIRRLGASRVATIGTLGPVATILLGDAFLDEPVTALQLTGAALVTAGVLAVSLKREPAAPVLPPSSPPVAAPLPPRP
jgi:drug/metabolite transporter (DMT)-like permease